MFVVALLCIACAAYWLWSRMNAKTTEPPYLPGAWHIVGHAPLLVGDGCNLWNRINDFAKQSYDLGGVLSASIGPRTVYIVTDPNDSFKVATTCYEKDDMYDFLKPWFGDGLLTARCKAYAMMSMKTTLAHVVRRYRIKADHTKLWLRFGVTLNPVAGHYISIERRT